MTQADIPEGFPRELAPGIHWIGACLVASNFGTTMHTHTSAYVVVGEDKTLLFDTGLPVFWPSLEAQLERVLAGRSLDWLIPTHPEIPHSGCLQMLAAKYPAMRIGGDIRDYHLLYPGFLERMEALQPGDEIDLGGGYSFVILPAIIKDLANTIWGYEPSQEVLFPADGFGYTHQPPASADDEHDDDAPLYHLPGECALTSDEFSELPNLEQTGHLTRSAFYWARYVPMDMFFARVYELLERFPARILAPAHGNPITNLDELMPLIREAHQLAYNP